MNDTAPFFSERDRDLNLAELAVLDLVAGHDSDLGRVYTTFALTRDDDNTDEADRAFDRQPYAEELLRSVPVVAQLFKVSFLDAIGLLQEHLRSMNHWADDPELEVRAVERRYLLAKAERDATIRQNWTRVSKIEDLVDLNRQQVEDILSGKGYKGGRRYR